MSEGTGSAGGGTQAWFVSGPARPEAAVRLFVLPYAGGSAAAYARWGELFPAEVEVCPVQLPGRQNRRMEPPCTDLEALVEALYDAVEDELDGRPFAFFGHSMGGLLGYRLTVAMAADGGPQPALLAVSAWAGAAHRPHPEPIEQLDEEEFLERVRKFGALPPEVAENRELRKLVLPALRADFCVVNGYRDDAAPVPCPVVAYTGRDDPMLDSAAMHSWAELTGDFRGVREFQGGHFYLHEQATALAADLSLQLRHR